MRILHVDPERAFSGGEVQVFLLMEGLRQLGHENVLVCAPKSRSEREARSRGLEVRPVSITNNLDLVGCLRLKRVISSTRPDLVHLHTGRASWIGGWAAWLDKTPALSTRRMDRPIRDNWRTRCIYGRLLRQTAAISPAVLEQLHRGGVPEARTRLIWSSVDPTVLEPLRDRRDVRQELGVNGHGVLMFAAGNLTRRKGFDILLEAFSQLQSDEARLVIAGDGEESPALTRRIREGHLGDRVQLLGQRADIPDLLAACDLFVMPSRAEGLGIAALEAMAASKPVIVSDVGGLRDIPLHQTTGLLVPPGRVAPLLDAMQELVGDEGKRAAFGSAGPARVRDKFSVDRMVMNYDAMYQDVLAEGRR